MVTLYTQHVMIIALKRHESGLINNCLPLTVYIFFIINGLPENRGGIFLIRHHPLLLLLHRRRRRRRHHRRRRHRRKMMKMNSPFPKFRLESKYSLGCRVGKKFCKMPRRIPKIHGLQRCIVQKGTVAF